MTIEQAFRGLRFRPYDNLRLKVIAVLLAIGLWSLVPDASVPMAVRRVPIRLGSLPPGLALAEPFGVELEVWVRGSAVHTRDLLPGELSPRLDLFRSFAGANTISLSPADIDAPFGVTVESISPAQIQVMLEELVRAELPVNAVVAGDPAPGFDIVDKRVEPPTVVVVGPRSRVAMLESLATEVVNVAGQSGPVTRQVAVVTNDPLVNTADLERVRLTITIEETPVVLEVADVPVRIVNAEYRVDINPVDVGVMLRGPPSLIAGLRANNLRVTIDVGGLTPRADDYSVAPQVRFEPAELADRISVLTLTPQQRLDVHVYDQPAVSESR